ncbi:MAG: M56 family metallopeptidase [Bacteroidaceae bacterium]|nr:M56 family metallopeptidase [Bacteroidaceae bacterium]
MTNFDSLIPMLQGYGSILLVSTLLMAFYLLVMSRKQSFRFQRMYLLAIPAVCFMQIIALAVLPKIMPQEEVEVITLTQEEARRYQYENPDTKVIAEEMPATEAEGISTPTPLPEEEQFVISASTILKCIYLGIPIVSALLLLIILIPLVQLLLRTRAIRLSNMEGSCTIVRKPWVSTPFSMGRIIFLPMGKSKEAEEIFIKHEKAHIQSLHYIDVWCIEVMVRLLWFNPMLWVVRKYLRDLHEFEADHLVLAQGVDVHSYQCLLLEVASDECSIFTNGFNQSFIRRRIKEMKRKGVTVLGHWGKTSAILWCITLVGASTIFAMPEQDAVVIRIEKQITATGDTIYSDSEVKDRVRQLRSEGKLELVNGLLIELEAGINVTEVVEVSPHDTICLDEKTIQIIAQMYRNNPKALYEALGRPQPTEEELAKKRFMAKKEKNKHLYSHRLRKHLGLSRFLPANSLKFVDTFMLTYSFGDLQKQQGSPVFNVGAICTSLFDNFFVLTMTMDTTIVLRHEQYRYAPNYFPTITGWMLKNCDTYWREGQIEYNGGVDADTDDKNSAPLSAKERAKVKSTIKQLRAKYERTFTSGEFIENTNADKIFVVQLPHIEEIKNAGTLNDRIIRENAKKCYAIEFYKKGRKDAMRMLIFTYEEVSIETILGKVSRYIRFE